MSNPWDKSTKTVVVQKDDVTETIDKNTLKSKALEIDEEVTEAIEKNISRLNTIENKDFVQATQTEEYSLSTPSDQSLGQILMGVSKLSPDQLKEALAHVEQDETRSEELAEFLLKKHMVTESEMVEALSLQTGVPIAKDLASVEIEPDLIEKIPISFAKKHSVMPFLKQGAIVYVATANPHDLSPIDDLRVLIQANIKPMLAPKAVIMNAINKAYDRTSKVGDDLHQDLMEDLENQNLDNMNLQETQDLLDSDDEAPIIRLINTLLFRAVKERASDIHIEPFEKDISVRYRIDGVLYEIMTLPKKAQASISSRVKIMADLDIAEKRIPQDGRIKIKIGGRNVDIRVSTLPASYGESIVMRLLVTSSELPQLEDLGFDKSQLQIIRRVTKLSHGIFLVTGPTGSGKSTTLYTAVSSMNSKDRKIITVEDPVERQLGGVMQIQVNPKVNLTFASGLRSILRQDPDVIMIGEIRDLETAEIAIQASLTGHFVFSTIHTNDSAGSITRLIDMGVEPFLVASSLVGAMAQRLVRQLCDECKELYQPSDHELKEIGITPEEARTHKIYRSVGCSECANTGYQGRLGIYEIMPVDDKIRQLISKNADAGAIRKAAASNEVKFLRTDGSRKILQGLTSVEEVLRVTQEESLSD